MYQQLVQHWLSERYQLRYCQIQRRFGVFTNVLSPTAKAKLRLLYEVSPLGLIVETAGGVALHESKVLSALDTEIKHTDDRLGVCFLECGNVQEIHFLRWNNVQRPKSSCRDFMAKLENGFFLMTVAYEASKHFSQLLAAASIPYMDDSVNL